jgi:hypothetical protein
LHQRYKRYRRLGEYTSYFRATLERELTLLQEQKAQRPKGAETPSSQSG